MSGFLRNLARIAAGLLFIFSGYVKAIDPMGSAIKFGEYFEAFGTHFLVPGALFFGIALALVELLAGLCFLFGLRMKQVSWLALLFMIFMTGLTLVLAVTDKVKDCGCFGDAIKLTNWQTFYKNLIILPVVAYIFAMRRKFAVVMYPFAEWSVVTALAAACMILSIHTHRHLPLIDFMPYKVGVNLPEAMTRPEGAAEDEYEVTLIYEKDGKKEKFTMDNYPAEDSTWTFVDSESKLIKAGYIPPAQDFAISTFDGAAEVSYIYEIDGVQHKSDEMPADSVEVTTIEETGHIQDMILSHPGYLFFLTSSEIKTAAHNKFDAINTIFDYAKDKDMKFIMLSGSSYEETLEYITSGQGKYKAYFTDETVLKSMVRSNPGLILLKDGVILRKWSRSDFPSVEELNKLINESPASIIKAHKNRETASSWAFVAIVALLFLCFSFKTMQRNRR
ncbi:MAG: DoxX family protein [Prevotellaceae bacterium]|jgi:uncharacterized membrane protein YphA (DoxX/SURF4 family)|nr:DoxX family protein [Prevotellaceae bacterium]